MFWSLYCKVSLMFLVLSNKVVSKKVAEIYWNSSNPIFSQSNNFTISARIRDSVDFICPKYETNFLPKETIEHSVIYMVNEQDFERCSVEQNANVVGICKYPFKDQLITIVFREFTPNPNGLEFRPNNKYYFISSSTGAEEGLYNLDGGLCRDKNMKLIIDIKPRQLYQTLQTPSVTNTKRKCHEEKEHEAVISTSIIDKLNFNKKFDIVRKEFVSKTVESVTRNVFEFTSNESKTVLINTTSYSTHAVTIFDKHFHGVRSGSKGNVVESSLINFMLNFLIFSLFT